MSLTDTAASPASSIGGARRPAPGAPAAEWLSTYPWTRQATLLAVGAVLALAVVAAIAWPLRGAVVPWDSKNQFYPFFRFLADALHHGGVPFWNPYQYAGLPSIADPQSLIFTPSLVLFALVAPSASMQVFDAVIFAHLAGGALGVVGLARRWGWHPAAAVLAATVFLLGGAASSRLQHTGMIISYSYFPFALWSLEAALERISYKRAALFAVLGALMALGRDQVAFLFCGVLVGRVVWEAAASGAIVAYLRPRLGILAFAGFLVVAILAVPNLLTLQFLATSNRPDIPLGLALTGSLAPMNFVTMFVPDFFGSLGSHHQWGPTYGTTGHVDYTDRAVRYLFIGTVPAVLVVWHGVAAGRLLGRGARFFAAMTIIAAMYALGRYTPLFDLAFAWIPGVSLYRRPADANFLVNVGLAFAAGYLLHRYVDDGLPHPFRPPRKALPIALAAVAILGAALLIGFGLACSARENHLANSFDQLAIAGIFAAVSVVLLLGLGDHPRRRALAAILLAAATGGELIWRDAASSMNAMPVEHYSIYAAPSQSEAAGREILQQAIAAKHAAGEHPRVEILGLVDGWQNASLVLKFEDTLGYNPLRIAEYERAVGVGENAVDFRLRHFPGTFRGYRCKLAKLLGIEYLVLDRPLAQLPRHVPRPAAATLIYAGQSMYIYKLPEPAPRAYFATEVKPIDDNKVLANGALPDFDRSREVLIDQTSMRDVPDALLRQAPEVRAKARTVITHIDDDHVAIDVDTDTAGVVVLHDLYYPGWQVRVDDVEKPLLHANLLFRGVAVSPGHHRVEFSFRPLSLANLRAAAASLGQRHAD